MSSSIARIAVALSLKDEFSAAIARAGKATRGFEGQLKGLDGTAGKVARSLNGIGNGLSRWGSVGAVAVGGGMALGLQDAATQAINVEHRLAGIANTAGIAQDRFKSTVGTWKTELVGMSQQTNQTQGDLLRGFDALISKGLDPDAAIKMTRSAGHAATATGADVEELGRSLYATYDNLKVPLSEADKALEAMAFAGNAGAFELKNMSVYFPQLTASASQLGVQGTKGVASLGAALQIALKGAGNPEEAAGNLKNFLAKLSSPETVKNFKKFGVNYAEEMKKAIASGDPVMYFTQLTQKITKGDRLKLGQLFGDMQVQNFLAPMLANLDEYQKIRNGAAQSEGLIKQQEVNMLTTAAEQMKRLRINTEATVQSSEAMGVSLGSLTEALGKISDSGLSKVGIGAGLLGIVGGAWLGGSLLKRGAGWMAGRFGKRKGDPAAGMAEAILGGGDKEGGALPVFVTNWPDGAGGNTGSAIDIDAPTGKGRGLAGAAVRRATQSLMFMGVSSIGQIAGMGAGAIATSAAGVAAAGAVGYGIGTILNSGINLGLEKLTGEAGATLGGKIYDWLHQDELAELNRPVSRAPRTAAERATVAALPAGSQSPQKVNGTIEVKVQLPNYVTGEASVTQPSNSPVKLEPKVGRYAGGTG